MKPELFGRGSWYFIFKIFYYYKNQEEQCVNLVKSIKDKKTYDKKLDAAIKIFFKNNKNFTYDIIKEFKLEDLIKKVKVYNIEQLKKKLSYIINGLPCEECKQHALEHMSNNNIHNSIDFLYIFHFFIELRNHFYSNKINRELFDSIEDLSKNEQLLFYKIINTNI